MSYSISIPNLFSVSAPSARGLEAMIFRALELREAHKAEVVTPASPIHIAARPVVSSEAIMPNVAKLVSLTGSARFRMTQEERATYGEGDNAREEAAKARLLAMGEEPAESGPGAAPGLGDSGETWSGELGTEVVTDFD